MVFAAILAGGIGKRLNCQEPKQFLKIHGIPILAHSIEKFVRVDEFKKIIISSPKEYINETQELVNNYFPLDKRLIVIEGGVERRDTILNSIDYALKNGANDDSVLATHDAARIFASPDLIKKSIKYAQKYGAASPVIPATDVIFESKNGSKLDFVPLRENLYHSQTPQTFNIKKYLKIYNDLEFDEIEKLDEAMVLFNMRDEYVHLFVGEKSNFKITRPFDVKIAETMFND